MRGFLRSIKDVTAAAKESGSALKICIAAAEALMLIAQELTEIKEELRKMNQNKIVTKNKV